MLASRLRRLAAAVLLGSVAAGAFGACGGSKFTLVDDAGGADDAGVGDAGTVDGSSADGGTVNYCGTHPGHFLCDDFDRASDDPKGINLWDSFIASTYTSGLLDRASSVSPPRSYLASTTKPGLGGTTTEELVFISKDVGHAKTVILQFDIMIESYGGTGMSPAGLVFVTYGQLSYGLIAFSPTLLTFVETLKTLDGGPGGMSTMHPASTGLPAGVWTHIAIQLNLPQGVTPGSAGISVGNSGAAQTPLTYTTTMSSSVGAAFGLDVTVAPTLWKIRYDNITIDKAN